MFGEREFLHQRILPRINELAKKYGEYVECIDLRWGLDTDHMGKILEVCLSQIRNPCRYNMIIFMGDYYGTIVIDNKNPEFVDVDTIRNIWKKSIDAEEELSDYNISVTQLELEYGLFRKHGNENVPTRICLIRERNDGSKIDLGQDDNQAEKQKELIKRVRGEKNDNTYIIDYKADWDIKSEIAVNITEIDDKIVDLVETTLKKRSEEKQNDNWAETALLEAETFRTQLAYHFRGRDALKCKILEKISSASVHTVLVYGASASGKSSILSKIYEEYKNEKKYFIACGHAMRSKTYLDVLLQMIYFVEKNLKSNSGKNVNMHNFYSEEKAETMFLKVVMEYNETCENELLILVDALDKLRSSGKIKIENLLESPGKVKIICSRMTEQPNTKSEGTMAVKMTELEKNDINEIVRGNMVISDTYVEDIAKILCEQRQSGIPLYLTSAISILQMSLNEVRGMGHDGIYGHFKTLTMEFPNKITDLCWKTLMCTGEYLEFPSYEMICGMIAASENGLRSRDLRQILLEFTDEQKKNSEWAFDLFRAYLDKNQYFRIQENGCWTFGHDLIKEGVKKNLANKMDEYKKNLFTYLQGLPAHDEVKIEEGLLLCAEQNEYEFAHKIFEEFIEQKDNKKEVALIIQTLFRIVFDKGYVAWYIFLAEKYSHSLIKVLERGLRYDSGPEYDRRYLAKELTDLYWKTEYIRHLSKTFDHLSEKDKILFCATYAEYVGIYDDISRQASAFVYEIPVYEYICKKLDFKHMSDENKAWIFKMANLVFYSNNKLIKYTREGEINEAQLGADPILISSALIEWYRENILESNDQFEGRTQTEGKFVNNIGQYFNAIRDYSGAFQYRIQALRLKAAVLFDKIDSPDQYWKRRFDNILAEMKISIQTHKEFWEELKQKINVKKEGKVWNHIAVSYRTIATDCYYLADVSEHCETELRKALGFHELCIHMQEEPFVEDLEKELAVTLSRKFGVYVKLYCLIRKDLLEEDIKDMMTTSQKAVEKILRAGKLDEREKENLIHNIDELICMFTEDGIDCRIYKEQKRKLKKN